MPLFCLFVCLFVCFVCVLAHNCRGGFVCVCLFVCLFACALAHNYRCSFCLFALCVGSCRADGSDFSDDGNYEDEEGSDDDGWGTEGDWHGGEASSG